MNRSLAFLAPLAALLLAGCSPTKDSCHSPSIRCGDRCVDGSRDPSNCGGCGITCGAGQTCCGACVDLQTSALDCGACGARCPTDGVCAARACSCPPAKPDTCGTNPGACVNVTLDPDNCGTCGKACAGPGVVAADATCSSSACVCAGPPGATDCGGNPECVNTDVDPTHCGWCGNDCNTTLPHATCSGGACACGNAAFPDKCDGIGCVNFATDPANCGACGHACSGTTPSCSNGLCCASGTTNCSGSCVNTQTDAANCGACGHACAAGQACSGGTCGCSGATPTACGASCCAGTACCSGGTACQTQHDNGLGGHFFDCNPFFSPGTMTVQAATAAADSWAVGTTIPGMCDGFCIARQTPTACAIWCFDGSPNVGRATSGVTINCPSLCTFTGVTGNWR